MLDFPAVTAMHARVNPFFVPGRVAREPRDPVRAFHRALPGYAPTPLHRCDGLARALGLGELRVKDESHRFGAAMLPTVFRRAGPIHLPGVAAGCSAREPSAG